MNTLIELALGLPLLAAMMMLRPMRAGNKKPKPKPKPRPRPGY